MTRREHDATQQPVDWNGSALGVGAFPRLSLPQGGGAIGGLGEKFAANPVTGTGGMTIPLGLSAGRSGFGPQLALTYDSGAGNGAFGLGWNVAIPAITRRTSRGLPRYADAEESDVFLLAGAEDLVPVLGADGRRQEDLQSLPGTTVHRYRPRTEGLFARVERHTVRATGDVRWRVVDRDNVTSWFGPAPESRIADPADPTRIFSWLLSERYDDKGNAMAFRYVAENDEGVDQGAANERHRERAAHRYLKRILYGNRVSRLVQPDLAAAAWHFEAVFDYGDHDAASPSPADDTRRDAAGRPIYPWPVRPDPFSVFRAGFEVRLYRRCRRILMFHRFAELGATPCLVRSTGLDYADFDYAQPRPVDEELAHDGSTRAGSLLRRVVAAGHVRDAAGAYLTRSLPALEFHYSRPVIDEAVRPLDRTSAENLPEGLDGVRYQWVDLEGEGVAGLLTQQASAWYYKDNQGEGRFGPARQVATIPNLPHAAGGRSQWLDVGGEGRLDLVTLEGPTAGFFTRRPDATWSRFRPLAKRPVLRWDDPNLVLIDLDGDGRADVLLTEQDAFTWHPALGDAGFGPARKVALPEDDEAGPRLVLADGSQSIYLADMAGDGLTALVRIRNGEICYWPNLGYGRFGAKVTMDQAPWLDRPDRFDQRRVRLADIDGSGTTDLIYLGEEGASLYFNQCGNRWSEARRLATFPAVNQLAAVRTIDLAGNGTACLVWSSPLPGDARASFQYVDLLGGRKPHLLVGIDNHLGAETRLHYRASTHFYLADKAAGRPWVTRLPFPVHVVERVEVFDHLSGNRCVTRSAYHHGYFDGVEREFRGFGMVEQWETDDIPALTGGGAPADDPMAAATPMPPAYTRTWFHTGAYLDRQRISNFHAGLGGAGPGEYFREPGLSAVESAALLLDDTVLPPGLTLAEEREACRALRGSLLRRELYAADGTANADQPYTVLEQNFTLRLLQPKGGNPHAVFHVHSRETLEYHYERTLVPVVNGQRVTPEAAAANPLATWRADPRVTHQLILEVDAFGQTLREAGVWYGRRYDDPDLAPADQARQRQGYVVYRANRVTQAIQAPDTYRTPRFCERAEFELTGLAVAPGRPRFDLATLAAAALNAGELAFEATPAPNLVQRRLLRLNRLLFRRDDLAGGRPLGELSSRALPLEGFELAFTPGLLPQELSAQGQPLLANAAAVLGGTGPDEGGYVSSQTLKAAGLFPATDADDLWWRPTGQLFFSPDGQGQPAQELQEAETHFFQPRRLRSPFHAPAAAVESVVSYDAYDLLPVDTRDPLGNRVTVGWRDAAGNLGGNGNDYRVLQPAQVMDANRNQIRAAFDALGLVVGTAVAGKPAPAAVEGDSLQGFLADLPEAEVLGQLQDPLADPAAVLGHATTRVVYDLQAFERTRLDAQPRPVVTCTIARETHDGVAAPPAGPRFRRSFSYFDGFGRECQRKIQAEPGPVPLRDPAGRILVDAAGRPQLSAQVVAPRWVGSGWTIYNNRGLPVRRFEPFFSDRQACDFDVRIGVGALTFYDPVGRRVATLWPDHTWAKTVVTPWRVTSWDAGDTLRIDDPSSDPDAGSFFRSLPPTQYLPTWFGRRDAGDLGPEERAVARRAAIQAATPGVAHGDALGRPFLSVAHNRHKYSDTSAAAAPVESLVATRLTYDILGRQRELVDARGRVAQRCVYDLLGRCLRQASMEAGERWMLADVADQPIRAWDSRGHRFRTAYDQGRRPVRTHVLGADPAQPNLEMLTERVLYGERHPEAEARNLRGVSFLQLDGAGTQAVDARDFKGNVLQTTRRLAREYRRAPDWQAVEAALPPDPAAPVDLLALAAVLEPRLEGEIVVSATTFDALNRPVEVIPPHMIGAPASRLRPRYNEANLLEQVELNLRDEQDQGQRVWTPCVRNVDYDARGRRTLIRYGNDVETRYRYDAETFRLTQFYTRRGAGFTNDSVNPTPPPARVAAPADPAAGRPSGVQNLRYSYDPAGNIMRQQDDAQRTLFFRNRRVDPGADYTYDALGRLIEATGREHLGQVGGAPIPHSSSDAPRVGLGQPGPANLFQPGDGNALGRFRERYRYDAAGNLTEMQHHRLSLPAAGWTRTYDYEEPSQLEQGQVSNRLTRTLTSGLAGGPDRYRHDAHGNMIRLPHLAGADPVANVTWNHRDQLQAADRGAGGGLTYYVYDGAGERVRKVSELAPGLTEERIYLGGCEWFRRRNGAGDLTAERETLHVMDGSQRVAVVESRTVGDDPGPARLVRYQLGNPLGSSCVELDDQARIITHEEYSPYGSTTYQGVRSAAEAPKRYRFSGQERDEETGLNHHGARYYATWLGRWTSADPAGYIDGWNLFAYCRCCPVNLVDANGHQSYEPPKPGDLRRFLADLAAKSEEAEIELGLRQSRGTTALSIVEGSAGSVSRGVDVLLAHSHVPSYDPTSGPSHADLSEARWMRKDFGGTGPRQHAVYSPNDRSLIKLSASGDNAKVLSFKPSGEVTVQKLAYAPGSPTNPYRAVTPWEEIQPELKLGPVAAAVERGKAVLSSPLGEFAAQSGGGAGTRALIATKKVLETGVVQKTAGTVGSVALMSLVDTPVSETSPGVPGYTSGVLTPGDPHLGDAISSELDYTLGNGPRPSHMDPNRASPEVPAALGGALGFWWLGPWGAAGGAILGAFVGPLADEVQTGFEAFLMPPLHGGTLFPRPNLHPQ